MKFNLYLIYLKRFDLDPPPPPFFSLWHFELTCPSPLHFSAAFLIELLTEFNSPTPPTPIFPTTTNNICPVTSTLCCVNVTGLTCWTCCAVECGAWGWTARCHRNSAWSGWGRWPLRTSQRQCWSYLPRPCILQWNGMNPSSYHASIFHPSKKSNN